MNKKNIIFLGGFIVLVVLFLSITHFDQKNNQPLKSETPSQQSSNESSDSEMIDTDQNNQQSVNLDDEAKNSESKEIRIVAEEILYPDEYDFGDSMSSVFIAAGKPIKLDTLPLTKLQQGDTFQLEFNNISIEAIMDEVSLRHYTKEQTDENQGNLTVKRFSGILNFDTTRAHNFINGSVTYGENGVVDSSLWIDSKYGEYQFDIYKNVGYYVEEGARQKEVYDRGIRID